MSEFKVSITKALDDPKLLGGAIRDPATWLAWRALLRTLLGDTTGFTEPEESIFRSCTNLTDVPTAGFAILWLICGRRGGKSFAMALVAVYVGLFKDWRPFLSQGERAVVLVVAADREQAKVIKRYVSGILAGSRLLCQHVVRDNAEDVELKGDVVIEVATCSFRAVRGRSVCVALLDETAFWRSEATANPDVEVWRAIRASMAQFGPDSVSIIASSPYARKGLLYDGWKRHFGKVDARNLVWQAPTKVMNPTISHDFITEAYDDDPVSAASEYGAAFRSDVETFVDLAVVEAAVDEGTFERPPLTGVGYVGFVDPSGGSKDSMTLAIGHIEDNCAVIDVVRERKAPFSPEDVVAEFAGLLKSYGIKQVTGDRYAGMWPRERFTVHGITYEPAARPKSDLYRDLLPILNGGRVRLVDQPKLVAQIASLERRTARGGRDSIDHPPSGHDDVANVVAGVVSLVIGDGAPDPVPVAEVGRYSSRICGSGSSAADRRDELSLQQALAFGLISPERAAQLGVRE